MNRTPLAAMAAAALWTASVWTATPLWAQNETPPPQDHPPAVTPADQPPAVTPADQTPAEQAPAAVPPAPTPAAPGDSKDEAPLPEGSVLPMKSDRVVFESAKNASGVELINVAVDNETLENVVAMFTKLSGANIVSSSANLTGTVTVNLKGVDWKAALSSILDLHDLALAEKTPGSGVYSIVPKPPPTAEPVTVETFFLKYTTVAEVKPIIAAMLPGGTNLNITIADFPSRNAMIVKTTEPNLIEIRKLVQNMDQPGKQVCVETKFMELSDRASKQLGIRWDSLEEFGVRLGAGPFTYDRKTTHDRLRSTDYQQWNRQQNIDQTKKLYDKDGVQIEELKIEYIAIPGTTNFERIATVSPTHTISDTLDVGSDDTRRSLDQFTRNITEQQTAILEMQTLDVVLSALKKTEGANIISNPKIIVTSGSSNAFFSVGEREPIIRTEIQRGTQDSPGDKLTANLDTTISTDHIKGGYLETGISLQVVPVVKTDEMIEASIYPRLVRLIGSKEVGENSWPRISVKEIKTTFTLRSGQTVAIGGLTDSSDDKAVTKVPLLGDIPIIGKYLFTHTADAKRQVETIIFVTLSLARPEELRRSEGIPEDAELVHQRVFQDERERQEFEKKLEELQKAAEAESQKASEKVKTPKKKR